MTQQLSALTAFPEDLSSVPKVHVRWLTTAGNSSSRGKSNVLFWDRVALKCPYTHKNRYIHINTVLKRNNRNIREEIKSTITVNYKKME